MSNRLDKVAETTFTPGVQAVLARPAYCVTTTVTRAVTFVVINGTKIPLIPDEAGDSMGLELDNAYGNGMVIYPGFQTYTEYVPVKQTVCYPATEGVEGRDPVTTFNNLLGWNAGAISYAIVDDNIAGRFTFQTAPIGVVCGFAEPTSPSTSVAGVQHGLYCVGDNIFVIENGIQIISSGITPSPELVLRVERLEGVVTYRIDDWSYTSTLESAGPKVLLAVLYCAGDYVDNPVLYIAEDVKGAAIGWDWGTTLDSGPFSLAMGWDWSTGYLQPVPWRWEGEITVSTLTNIDVDVSWDWGMSVAVNSGEAYLPFDMAVAGADYIVGKGEGEIADFTVTGYGGMPDVQASGVIMYLPFETTGLGSKISIGESETSFDFVSLGSEEEYGIGYVEIGDDELRVLGLEIIEPPLVRQTTTVATIGDTYVFEPTVFGVVYDGLELGCTFDAIFTIDGMYNDTLSLSSEVEFNVLLEAMISSGMRFSDDVNFLRRELVQYATNIVTGAVTTYSNFSFDGFADVSQVAYGWKADGLYCLEGNSDDGDMLSAIVEFAAEDMDSNRQQRVSNLFLGLRTDGDVFVRLETDDGVQRTYKASHRGNISRADTALGVASRFWRLRVELVDVSEAELDNVEWVIGTTGRRTTGRLK